MYAHIYENTYVYRYIYMCIDMCIYVCIYISYTTELACQTSALAATPPTNLCRPNKNKATTPPPTN